MDHSRVVTGDVLIFRIVKPGLGKEISENLSFMLKLTWITGLVHPDHLHITSFVSVQWSLNIMRIYKILLQYYFFFEMIIMGV